LGGRFGFAAADCAATATATIATIASIKPLALDPEITLITAERMTTSVESVTNALTNRGPERFAAGQPA
jgi:hypothetical protein